MQDGRNAKALQNVMPSTANTAESKAGWWNDASGRFEQQRRHGPAIRRRRALALRKARGLGVGIFERDIVSLALA